MYCWPDFWVLTWVNILLLAVKFGYDTTLVRFVASYSSQQQWERLKGIIGLSLIHVTVTGIAMIVFLASLALLFPRLIDHSYLATFWWAVPLLPVRHCLTCARPPLED